MPAVPTPVALRRCLVALLGALAVLSLAGPASARTTLGARTLSQGSTGEDVRVLQRLLRKAGFRTSADGVFGRGTRRVVRTFERELGLRVDGRITRSDVRRLRAALRPSEGTGGFGTDELSRPRAVSAQEAPGGKAQLTEDGLAIPPADAPEAVKRIIAAGNEIAKKPYRYGGGHGRWNDSGYDCSGSVSYALHGAGLLDAAMPSGSFSSWGEAGEGDWVTLYTNSGHMYMVVAGLRFDTSGRSRTGTRWQKDTRSAGGFVVRHPEGL